MYSHDIVWTISAVNGLIFIKIPDKILLKGILRKSFITAKMSIDGYLNLHKIPQFLGMVSMQFTQIVILGIGWCYFNVIAEIKFSLVYSLQQYFKLYTLVYTKLNSYFLIFRKKVL